MTFWSKEMTMEGMGSGGGLGVFLVSFTSRGLGCSYCNPSSPFRRPIDA